MVPENSTTDLNFCDSRSKLSVNLYIPLVEGTKRRSVVGSSESTITCPLSEGFVTLPVCRQEG